MKKILNVVFVIIGALIGAGFASGQEIKMFFFEFGKNGIFGIFISSILMGIVIYKTLWIIKKENITTYKEFLEHILEVKTKPKHEPVKNAINMIINVFILITFFIMIAGFGAYFRQEYGVHHLVGSILLATMCYLVFLKDTRGIIKVNEWIVPILIGGIILLGMLNLQGMTLSNIETHLPQNDTYKWIISCILYASYNSILTIPVLITLKQYITGKKQILIISLLITGITITLSILLFLLLIRVDVNINMLEMPIVYVVHKMFQPIPMLYAIIILGSIFTTAISLGISFLQNIAKTKKSYPQLACIMCITSVLISNIGFSKLINFLYPVFGYLGMVQIIKLIEKK